MPCRKKRSLRATLLVLTNHPVKSVNSVVPSLEQETMMPCLQTQSSYNVLKASSRNDEKSPILSLSMKSTSSTHAPRGSSPSSVGTPEKSNLKCGIKSIQRLGNGKKRERLKFVLVYYLSMRFICWISNVFHS